MNYATLTFFFKREQWVILLIHHQCAFKRKQIYIGHALSQTCDFASVNITWKTGLQTHITCFTSHVLMNLFQNKLNRVCCKGDLQIFDDAIRNLNDSLVFFIYSNTNDWKTSCKMFWFGLLGFSRPSYLDTTV